MSQGFGKWGGFSGDIIIQKLNEHTILLLFPRFGSYSNLTRTKNLILFVLSLGTHLTQRPSSLRSLDQINTHFADKLFQDMGSQPVTYGLLTAKFEAASTSL